MPDLALRRQSLAWEPCKRISHVQIDSRYVDMSIPLGPRTECHPLPKPSVMFRSIVSKSGAHEPPSAPIRARGQHDTRRPQSSLGSLRRVLGLQSPAACGCLALNRRHGGAAPLLHLAITSGDSLGESSPAIMILCVLHSLLPKSHVIDVCCPQ